MRPQCHRVPCQLLDVRSPNIERHADVVELHACNFKLTDCLQKILPRFVDILRNRLNSSHHVQQREHAHEGTLQRDVDVGQGCDGGAIQSQPAVNSGVLGISIAVVVVNPKDASSLPELLVQRIFCFSHPLSPWLFAVLR